MMMMIFIVSQIETLANEEKQFAYDGHKTRFKLVLNFYWHHVTKIRNLAANAPNDLLFVPYEAYYNVVLGNYNLKGLAYLGFVKNWSKVEKGPKNANFQKFLPGLRIFQLELEPWPKVKTTNYTSIYSSMCV